MKQEKRKARSYKIKDKDYFRAQQKAAKTEKSLAERIEDFVTEFGKSEYPKVLKNTIKW